MIISEIRNQIAERQNKMVFFRENFDLDRLEEEFVVFGNGMSIPGFDMTISPNKSCHNI